MTGAEQLIAIGALIITVCIMTWPLIMVWLGKRSLWFKTLPAIVQRALIHLNDDGIPPVQLVKDYYSFNITDDLKVFVTKQGGWGTPNQVNAFIGPARTGNCNPHSTLDSALEFPHVLYDIFTDNEKVIILYMARKAHRNFLETQKYTKDQNIERKRVETRQLLEDNINKK